jgi:tetratricopeptide (TPR) repeat protein
MLGRTARLGLAAVGSLLGLAGCEHTGAVRNPKLAQSHYLLGEDALRRKDPEGAKRELIKAVELDPDNREAHNLLGVIFFLQGLQKLNILEREQCLKGVAATEQMNEANKEFRRAEEYFKTVVALSEKEKRTDSEALNYLANVALHFKRFDEAIGFCRRALENILYSQRQLALGTLGWAYFQKGDRASAARELRQAVFQEPRFCLGRYRLAKVYYEDKAYDKAIEELKKVVEDTSCPIQEAYQLLGLALLKQGEPEQARARFEQCNKLNPRSCVSEECRRYARLM